jgi:hypothetical protein
LRFRDDVGVKIFERNWNHADRADGIAWSGREAKSKAARAAI